VHTHIGSFFHTGFADELFCVFGLFCTFTIVNGDVGAFTAKINSNCLKDEFLHRS
jgi:hypothetical protein